MKPWPTRSGQRPGAAPQSQRGRLRHRWLSTTPGALTGVTTIHAAAVATDTPNGVARTSKGIWRGAAAPPTSTCTGAPAGLIDSVIDVTHDVRGAVRSPTLDRRQLGRPDTRSAAQRLRRLRPTRDRAVTARLGLRGAVPNDSGAAGQRRRVTCLCAEHTADAWVPICLVPGPSRIVRARQRCGRRRPAPAAEQRLRIYIAGQLFTVRADRRRLPAAGTVWTLRDYVGAITGGNGAAGGNDGPYSFTRGDPAVHRGGRRSAVDLRRGQHADAADGTRT